MRTNLHRWTAGALLTWAIIGPIAPIAHARCPAERHACEPATAAVACRCVEVAAAERQPSLTTGIVVIPLPALVGAVPGRPGASLPQSTFARSAAPTSFRPVDRLALFHQLLI